MSMVLISSVSRCALARYVRAGVHVFICALSVVGVVACGGGNDFAPAAAGAQPTAAAISCESVRGLQLPNVDITATQAVAAGTYQPAGSTTAFADLPAFCRVTANLTPVSGSKIGMELWLPTTAWNGRYQQLGQNGWGTAFSSYWSSMAPQLRSGYAIAITDGGHTATAVSDASWAIGFPERVIDFAYRATHETAVASKAIVRGYYAKAASYAYFNGTSTGGRDGLMSAQKYPTDFNGVLAGPALINWTRVATQKLFASQQLVKAGIQGPLGTALLNLARRSSIAACDAADGATDGIMRDPRACRWDPHSLLCASGQDPSTCFTAAQADALTHVLSPLRDQVTSEYLYPGYLHGFETDWIGFGYVTATPAHAATVYKIALGNAAWDASTFNVHTDLPSVESALGFMNVDQQTDLSAFRQAGGKLIQYQGWQDAVTMPERIVQYYDEVRDRTSGGDRAAEQNFYRLFMMSGVGHGGAGEGPWHFGAIAQQTVSNDPEHDAVRALRDWVESGIAPEIFVATKFQNGDVTKPISLQRPLCPYPSQPVYKGSGDTNGASNFYCR